MVTFVARAEPAPASAWVNISDPVLEKLTAEGKKPAWPFASAGVHVDRASGDVFMVISGQGLFRSSDKGKTFARCDGGAVGGRCETGYAIAVDYARPGRFVCAMLDGKCALTLDNGKTWRPLKDVGRNWDYVAVDWTAEEPQTLFGMHHESGGQLMHSTDGGKSWAKSEKHKEFSAVGVAGADTLMTVKLDGIQRSTDGGKTWAEASKFTPLGRLAVTGPDGALYWMARDPLLPGAVPDPKNPPGTFLIVSKDKGATWAKQGEKTPAPSPWGPYFGKDEKHVVTLTKKGVIIESRDAGQTWTDVIQLPAKGYETSNPGWFVNVAYDPTGDVFYASRMGQPCLKYERGK
ncbi:MAG TPA: hypothetical protein VK986_27630 [Tepidisphaeraceae bacterium]|nr:hypothetical protein [Tepidisphaeraceae bacterium]